MMCDTLSELLMSVYDTVEDVAFSPESRVLSPLDGQPSTPVFLTPSSPASPWTQGRSKSFAQLTNAAVDTMTQDQCVETPSSVHGGLFSNSCDDWEKDWLSAECPMSASGYQGNLVDGDWLETQSGFQICHTGDGSARVKLTADLTYDIDISIDISDIPAVTAECDSRETAVVYSNSNNYTTTNNNLYSIADNISNNNNTSTSSTVFSYENCNSCLHNRNFFARNVHCPRSDCPHPPSANDCDPRDPCDPYDPAAVRPGRRQAVTRTERLWEFILRLLNQAEYNPRLIEWVDRDDGTFRLNNSKAIAYMWGMRKNNTQMSYEKLSRALRYYYHRQILEPVLGKKLVYRFGPNAVQVWKRRAYRPQGSR